MAKDKLVWEFAHGGYRIYWRFAEEADLGASLGQDKDDGIGDGPEDPDDWEHWAACKAVRGLEAKHAPDGRDILGWYWVTTAGVMAAIRVAKAAIAAMPWRPIPEWATKALAAGWKAPKGWKP